ncbi:MAG: hypothetical protein SFT92_02135 [Rickettsiales bacterium]|nr:hypothetical protein [Rickettsiales bacterium]
MTKTLKTGIKSNVSLNSSIYLQGHVRDLLNAAGALAEFMQQPIIQGKETVYALGAIGQIMASQLIRETVLIEQATHNLIAHSTDSHFEQARLSSQLHKKLAMIKTLISIVEQLPAATPQAMTSFTQLANKLLQDCDAMDEALLTVDMKAAVVTQSIHISALERV